MEDIEYGSQSGCVGCFGVLFFGGFFLLMIYAIYQVIIGLAPLFQ